MKGLANSHEKCVKNVDKNASKKDTYIKDNEIVAISKVSNEERELGYFDTHRAY